MRTRLTIALLSGLAICCISTLPARADDLDRPKIAAGDTWTYRVTAERGTRWIEQHNQFTVDHAGPMSIALDKKPANSDVPPQEVLFGADWSSSRDINGQQTVVEQPMSFPLKPGKTWTVIYSEDNPNQFHSNEAVRKTAIVIGWEDLKVVGGTFHALKIEINGEWKAQLIPRTLSSVSTQAGGTGDAVTGSRSKITAKPVSGRVYEAYWYVPSVKRWVKNVEEIYDSKDVRSERTIAELESYKVAP